MSDYLYISFKVKTSEYINEKHAEQFGKFLKEDLIEILECDFGIDVAECEGHLEEFTIEPKPSLRSFLEDELTQLKKQITNMAKTITELSNDFATFKQDLTDKLAAIAAQVASLQAAQGLSAEDQATIDALDQNIQDLDNTVKGIATS